MTQLMWIEVSAPAGTKKRPSPDEAVRKKARTFVQKLIKAKSKRQQALPTPVTPDTSDEPGEVAKYRLYRARHAEILKHIQNIRVEAAIPNLLAIEANNRLVFENLIMTQCITHFLQSECLPMVDQWDQVFFPPDDDVNNDIASKGLSSLNLLLVGSIWKDERLLLEGNRRYAGLLTGLRENVAMAIRDSQQVMLLGILSTIFFLLGCEVATLPVLPDQPTYENHIAGVSAMMRLVDVNSSHNLQAHRLAFNLSRLCLMTALTKRRVDNILWAEKLPMKSASPADFTAFIKVVIRLPGLLQATDCLKAKTTPTQMELRALQMSLTTCITDLDAWTICFARTKLGSGSLCEASLRPTAKYKSPTPSGTWSKLDEFGHRCTCFTCFVIDHAAAFYRTSLLLARQAQRDVACMLDIAGDPQEDVQSSKIDDLVAFLRAEVFWFQKTARGHFTRTSLIFGLLHFLKQHFLITADTSQHEWCELMLDRLKSETPFGNVDAMVPFIFHSVDWILNYEQG